MKKRNRGDMTVTEQRRKELAKARRVRRQVRLAAQVAAKLRLLVLQNGKLKQQLKQQEIELNGLRASVVSNQSGPSDGRGVEAKQDNGAGMDAGNGQAAGEADLATPSETRGA